MKNQSLKKIFFLITFLFLGKGVFSQEQLKDDTTFLQKIINSGLVVYLENPGTIYNVYGTVYLNDGQSVTGCGITIKQHSANTPIFDCKNKRDIDIQGITFIGHGNDYLPTSSSLAIGINCWGTKKILVRECVFKDFSYAGISGLRKASEVTIQNNIFTGTGLNNPNFHQKDHTAMTIGGSIIKITDNEISNSSQGIIIAEESSSVYIAKNNIHDLPLEHGIYVDTSCSDVLISKNTITNVGGSGIKVQNRNYKNTFCQNITIQYNSVTGTKLGDGILIVNTEGNTVYAENVTIFKNKLYDIGQHGINIRTSKKTKATENEIKNVKYSGIYLSDNYNLLIKTNSISSTNENGIFDEGSGEFISIENNTIHNPGINGIDKNGLSSGIFIATGKNRTIMGNTVMGDGDKMQYALYIPNGNQESISISKNSFSGARDYSIRLKQDGKKLRKFKSNTLNAKIGKKEILYYHF